jgi:hypothetical protein
MLQLEVDGVVDFTSHEDVAWDLHFGTEIFVANKVPIRVGYIYDIYYNIHSPSAGIGYVDTHFALDLGYQHEVRQDGRYQIAFAFKYFIN